MNIKTPSKPFLILSSGGHAKVVVSVLRELNQAILGLVDVNPLRFGQLVLGCRVLGDESVISQYRPGEVHLANGLGSVANMELRQSIFARFKERDFAFPPLIHPRAIVAQDFEMGEGTQIMAGVVTQPGGRIGRNGIINTGAVIDHDAYIGDHVHLAPGVILSGGVTIGDATHIGTGAVIKQGVKIGSNCTVGAGSLVLRDVEDGSVVYGHPARKVT